jgi:hypothetical protein
MYNEQQELFDEVYENYVKWWEESDDSCNLTEEQYSKWLKLVDGGLQWAPLTKEEFINKCKTDPEFSEKWGLKIEERELSLEERVAIFNQKKEKGEIVIPEFKSVGDMNAWTNRLLDNDIPTKLITITYNDKKINKF